MLPEKKVIMDYFMFRVILTDKSDINNNKKNKIKGKKYDNNVQDKMESKNEKKSKSEDIKTYNKNVSVRGNSNKSIEECEHLGYAVGSSVWSWNIAKSDYGLSDIINNTEGVVMGYDMHPPGRVSGPYLLVKWDRNEHAVTPLYASYPAKNISAQYNVYSK